MMSVQYSTGCAERIKLDAYKLREDRAHKTAASR